MRDELSNHGRNDRVQRRWFLVLLAAFLFGCISASTVQARDISAAQQFRTAPAAESSKLGAALSVDPTTQRDIVDRNGQDCPLRRDHLDHSTCTGSPCFSAALLPDAGLKPVTVQSGLVLLVTADPGGAHVAPLFHPPRSLLRL
jgi:hypothetical protein